MLHVSLLGHSTHGQYQLFKQIESQETVIFLFGDAHEAASAPEQLAATDAEDFRCSIT